MRAALMISAVLLGTVRDVMIGVTDTFMREVEGVQRTRALG